MLFLDYYELFLSLSFDSSNETKQQVFNIVDLITVGVAPFQRLKKFLTIFTKASEIHL